MKRSKSLKAIVLLCIINILISQSIHAAYSWNPQHLYHRFRHLPWYYQASMLAPLLAYGGYKLYPYINPYISRLVAQPKIAQKDLPEPQQPSPPKVDSNPGNEEIRNKRLEFFKNQKNNHQSLSSTQQKDKKLEAPPSTKTRILTSKHANLAQLVPQLKEILKLQEKGQKELKPIIFNIAKMIWSEFSEKSFIQEEDDNFTNQQVKLPSSKGKEEEEPIFDSIQHEIEALFNSFANFYKLKKAINFLVLKAEFIRQANDILTKLDELPKQKSPEPLQSKLPHSSFPKHSALEEELKGFIASLNKAKEKYNGQDFGTYLPVNFAIKLATNEKDQKKAQDIENREPISFINDQGENKSVAELAAHYNDFNRNIGYVYQLANIGLKQNEILYTKFISDEIDELITKLAQAQDSQPKQVNEIIDRIIIFIESFPSRIDSSQLINTLSSYKNNLPEDIFSSISTPLRKLYGFEN